MLKLTLAFLLIQSAVFGQLSGHYNHRNQWTSESIIFKKGHQFEYTYNGESESRMGTGRYKLKGDSLVLYFKKHPADTGNPDLQVQNQPHENGVCVMNVYVKEKRSQYAEQYAVASVLNKDGRLQGTQTNAEGKCELRMPATDDTVTLRIAVIGYPALTYKLVARGNYNIAAEIDNWQTRYYKDNEHITFYLTEMWTGKDLYLSRYKGSQAVRFSKRGK